MQITISARAMKRMQNELSSWPGVETGGVLLGYKRKDSIIIIEAVDGGYEKAIREPGRFQYDHKYVQHVCNQIINQYEPPLDLVGLWHKHNHSYSPLFSDEDMELNDQLCSLVKGTCCSILFQKRLEHCEEYLMRTCLVELGKKIIEVESKSIIIEQK